MTSPVNAANAYAALARLTDPAGALGRVAAPAGNGSATQGFAGMVKDALNSVLESGRKSDSQAQALAAGKANVVDVVTAVAETEVAVEAMVAVRDRVIAAYEDIMKMPI